MKVRLIQPAQLDGEGRPIKYEKVFLPFLTLATLAGLTPDGVELGLTDEFVQDVDFDEKVDLVGITGQTCQAPRAYQLADEFRKRGRKAILGGIHASMCPEEALQHFDAVLIGEAEDLWEKVLRDAKNGQLQRVYRSEGHPDLARLTIPRFDLMDFRHYVVPPFARTPLIPIQATRGCPHRCDFCSVSAFVGTQIRKKPVSNVMREIEHARPSRIFFTDDNIIADPSYSEELFKALKPLRTRWACQMSTRISKHPKLIDLAAESGCHETFIGIESLNNRTLRDVNKGFNRVEEYGEMFHRLRQAGILAQASIIFGFDTDDADDLKRVADEVMKWDVNYLYIQILVPLPGTPLHSRFKEEGRIIGENWSQYDGTAVIIELKHLKPEDLFRILWANYEKFYSLPNILHRAWRFKREYIRFFPRDFAIEEVFFQLHMRKAVKHRCHPFSLGFRRDGHVSSNDHEP